MMKIALSFIALAAMPVAAFAQQRNYDLRESDTYMGEFNESATVGEALAVPDVNAGAGDEWIFANGENVKDPLEARRIDEKNN